MQTKINKTEFFYAIKLIQKRFFFLKNFNTADLQIRTKLRT